MNGCASLSPWQVPKSPHQPPFTVIACEQHHQATLEQPEGSCGSTSNCRPKTGLVSAQAMEAGPPPCLGMALGTACRQPSPSLLGLQTAQQKHNLGLAT